MQSSSAKDTPPPAEETGGSASAGSRPVHGGIKPAELRALDLDPKDALDFSASISPLGPPGGIWEALHEVDLTAYPDPACLELKEALSRHLSDPDLRPRGIPEDRILVGNGSTELIHLLARAYLGSPSGTAYAGTRCDEAGAGGCALLLTPTYGEYTGACRLAGAAIHHLEARRAQGFSWDLEEAARRIHSLRPGLVFLCNPNNPTGVFLQRPEVELLAQAAAESGALLVVDEAYLSFVNGPWDTLALLERENVVLLRSMTKDYALTGLRLGYSLAPAGVTARLTRFQPDWSVNGLAQAAGLVALADAGYLPQARKAVNQAKDYLTIELARLGYTVLPSAANFLVIEVGDGAAMRDKLARRGLFVRDCASFGLPDCIRVGIRPLADCRRLVEGMRDLPGSGSS